MVQKLMMTKLMRWDRETRDSEQQELISWLESCDEEDMGEMFKQSTPDFDEKFMDFAFLVEGEIQRKL